MGIGPNPRGQEAVVISAVFSVIGNLVVFMRLYIRFMMIKKPGAEDPCIAIAMLFSTAFTILIKVQADAGLGIHVWELTDEQVLMPLSVRLITLLEPAYTELHSLFLPASSATTPPSLSSKSRSFFSTTGYFQNPKYAMLSTYSVPLSLCTASRPF